MAAFAAERAMCLRVAHLRHAFANRGVHNRVARAGVVDRSVE